MKVIITNPCSLHSIRGEKGCDNCLNEKIIEECYWAKEEKLNQKRTFCRAKRIHATDKLKCKCDPNMVYELTEEEKQSRNDYNPSFIYTPQKLSEEDKAEIDKKNIGFKMGNEEDDLDYLPDYDCPCCDAAMNDK